MEAGKDLTVNASKKADGGMNIEGGRDVTVIGSQLKAGGDMLLGATGDIAVLSGVEEHGSYSKKTKSGFLGLSKSGKSQLKTTATQVGSELEAGNDVVVAAGNDIRLRASEINAENDAELRAGLVKDTGDINLVSANDTAYSRSEKYEKKTGSISVASSRSHRPRRPDRKPRAAPALVARLWRIAMRLCRPSATSTWWAAASVQDVTSVSMRGATSTSSLRKTRKASVIGRVETDRYWGVQ